MTEFIYEIKALYLFELCMILRILDRTKLKAARMAELIVSIQAYCKILLHAVKHPHCAINGVLLAEDNKSKDRKVLKFVDCVPLFHLTLSLSPMLEAALLQV